MKPISLIAGTVFNLVGAESCNVIPEGEAHVGIEDANDNNGYDLTSDGSTTME